MASFTMANHTYEINSYADLNVAVMFWPGMAVSRSQ